MADQQHIEWLLEGVPDWNARRETHDFKPDLSGANLVNLIRLGINLSNSNLDDAILQGAHLSDADLTNAKLSNAILINAHLTHANLTGTWFVQSNLTGADLSDTQLANARLDMANLTDVNFTNADLSDANLSMANLTRACFAYTQPWQAYLYGQIALRGDILPTTVKQHPVGSTDINTIDDLLAFMRNMKHLYIGGHNEEITFYFRGEPQSTWNLSPSIMRSETKDIAPYENEMLRKLISRRPDEFSVNLSAISQWALGQHHGLKTRFLDITKNPLAALFFACESDDDQAGRIHVFAVPQSLIKSYDSDAIRIVANFARMSEIDRWALSGKLDRLPSLDMSAFYDFSILGPSAPTRYAATFNRLYQQIREEKPNFEERIDIRDLYRVFVVEPQHSSERIRAQAGAFLVSAFHERFERDEILAKTKGLPVYAHYTLTVPSESKGSLIDELASLSITRETLFPGLDESAKAAIDEARRRGR